MKTSSSLRIRPLATAILCTLVASLAPVLRAQTTATTVPVGFITVTIPAAPSPSTPSNASLSIPLYNTAAYASSVAALVGATDFTLSGAAWTASQFADPANPYLVRIKGQPTLNVGANVGRTFLIIANTTNQLTVALPTGVANINAFLSANDLCEIVPANTLGKIFGTTTPILQAGDTPDIADNVYILNGTTWEAYFHNGLNWRKNGGIGNKNNTIIYPDDGLFVVHITASPVVLTLMGTVPSTTEQTELIGGGSTFIANRFPTDVQLVNTGIQLLPNWVTGAVEDADLVYTFNGALNVWETYYHNGTSWRKGGGIGNKDTTIIPAGTALVISRHNVSGVVLSQALPYVP